MSHYQLCGYVLHVPLSLLLEHVFSSVDKHILIHIHMIRNLILKEKMVCSNQENVYLTTLKIK